MKTAIELADEFPEQNLANIEPDAANILNWWGIEAVAMLRQQAEQIEALTKMLVISDHTHQTWMKANAPRGWIDDLRIERDALKQQAQIHAIEAIAAAKETDLSCAPRGITE